MYDDDYYLYFYDNYCKSFAMIDSIFFNVRLLLGSYYFYYKHNDSDFIQWFMCNIYFCTQFYFLCVRLIFLLKMLEAVYVQRNVRQRHHQKRDDTRGYIFEFKYFMLWYAIKMLLNLVSCIFYLYLHIMQTFFMIFCCYFNMRTVRKLAFGHVIIIYFVKMLKNGNNVAVSTVFQTSTL